ncbi:MAG: signal transduction histidine kinase [Polyangiales bacterium]|jgi:signal transduction histidine kinase
MGYWRSEVRDALGYNTTWLAIYDDDGHHVRMLMVQGDNAEHVWESAAVIPVDGDPYMERIRDASTVQIIEDAQLSPDVNREIVVALGNRTIINQPLRLIDRALGAIGLGTFGEEGVRLPTLAELAYLENMSQQLVMASARLLLDQQRQEAAAERQEFQRKLAQRRRLESLGQLAAEVAHEFNNLLTIILASASIIVDADDLSEAAEDLQNILDAGNSAATLTHKLLTLGKEQPLVLDEVDVKTVLDKTAGAFQHLMPSEVTLDYVAPPKPLHIIGDEGQIQRLLLNLLLNARDAVDESENRCIALRGDVVELDQASANEHPGTQPGHYVRVAVQDWGTGMAPDVLDRIFEPFFTTKGHDKGSGLGLAICRGLVEQHGGFLHAQSSAGGGSTFEVYLPSRE